MAKTLKKAFDILRAISEEPQRPHYLGEIAKKLDINQSTCAFVLKTMVECGFVDQEAPRRGYTLGPMAYYITRNGPYRKDIVNAAKPLMRELVEGIKESAVIAVMQSGRRITLCVMEADQEVQICRDCLLRDDVYRTATGILLLAYLSQSEIKAFIAKHGLSSFLWPEVRTEDDLKDNLRRIRENQVAINQSSQYTQIAVPIREGEKVVAALGVPVPKFRFESDTKERIIQAIKETAEKISVELSQISRKEA